MSPLRQKTLFEIIREKVGLGAVNSRGWYEVRCRVCNDHSPRCGFIHDGASTSVYCWNCGIKARYEEGSGRLSRNFRRVLEAFGIGQDDLLELQSAIFSAGTPNREITLEDLRSVRLETPEVSLPEKSLPLGCQGHEAIQRPLLEYLERRRVDPRRVRAHFSLHPRFLRRVILPFYRNQQVIYWQARHIDPAARPRYLNCPAARDAVIYGYDELLSGHQFPLFVTEGVFDAIVLNGVCLLGASLSAAKIELLRRARRRIIFVIDRDQTGKKLGKAVIENGWEFSFVDARVKDASESVTRFGLPYTIHCLLRNATRPTSGPLDQARLSLGILAGQLRPPR